MALANGAIAASLIHEPFSYAGADLINGTNGPNKPNPPFWTNSNSFATKKIQVVGGEMLLNSTAVTVPEYPSLAAGSTLSQGQTWYAGFDLLAKPQTKVGGPAPIPFSSFGPNQSEAAGAFTLAVPLAGSANQTYAIGLENNPFGTNSGWPTELEFDTSHRIVMAFTLDPDNNPATQDSVLRLWVDPTNENSPSISVTTLASPAVNSFDFHWQQRGLEAAGDVFVDNFDLATTFAEAVPEPPAFALLSIGGVALAWAGLRDLRSKCRRGWETRAERG